MNKFSKLVRDMSDIKTAVEYENRSPGFCTGKSLSKCLKLLGNCLENPDVEFNLREHLGQRCTIVGGELDHLKRVIENLDLKYLEIHSNTVIVYKPWGYAELKTEWKEI